MRSLRVVIVVLSLALACTPPPVSPVRPELLARADAELLAGCYDCLLEARASYRRLATGRQRSQLLQRLFEADLLVAMRETELGLPASDALAEARRLAAELPPRLEAPRILALVEAIPGDELGLSRRELRAFRAARTEVLSRLRGELAWLAGSSLRAPVRDYLRRSLDCAYARPPTPGETDGAPPDAPLLLRYRAEVCELGMLATLAELRAREPRFVETSFAMAKIELALAFDDGPRQAQAHLAEARARFPRSAAIAYLGGSYELSVANYQGALALFDRTLAIKPSHEQALVGRAAALSNLLRHPEAIDAANRLIALGEDTLADGYYWRAWNRHALGQLAEARADITVAKEWAATPSVLGLSGIIRYDLDELDAAEADLGAAIAAGGDCTSRWYLALVHRKRKTWAPAGQAFQDALGCYRTRAETSRAQISALESRTDIDTAYRDSAIAGLRSSIEADTRQWHLAALLAAGAEASAGHADSANALLELAAEDPSLADGVAKLRGILERAKPAERSAPVKTRPPRP